MAGLHCLFIILAEPGKKIVYEKWGKTDVAVMKQAIMESRVQGGLINSDLNLL